MNRTSLSFLLVAALLLTAATTAVAAPRLGQAAPDFTLPTIAEDGDTALTLSDLQGKWVLLDFWATWCGPCISAMRGHLNPMWQEYGDQADFWTMVSIGTNWRGDTADRQLAFVDQNSYGWNFVHDGEGEVTQAYGVRGIPTLCVVDPEGNVAALGYGDTAEIMARLLDEEEREEVLEEIEANIEAAQAEWEALVQEFHDAPALTDEGVTGSFEQGGRAIYRVELAQDGTLSAQTFADGENMDTILTLYDAELNVITENDDNGRDLYSAITSELAAGTYYVVVTGYSGSGGSFGLRCSVETAAEEAPEPPADEEAPEEDDAEGF